MARSSVIASASAGLTMILTTLLTIAQAQAAENARTACRADYDQFCKSVAPGGGRIVKCLADNADKLSPACKSAMADAKAARAGGAK
jgi:pyruvate carboxylase